MAALEEAEKAEPSLPRFERLRWRFSRLPRLVRWLTPVAITLAVAVGVGLGLWTIFSMGTPPPTPEPPEVCLPSPTPVKVAVAQLSNCPPDSRIELLERWTNNITAIAVPLDQPFETSTEVRAHTDKADYNLVVWGECEQPETGESTLHYELLTSRKPAEIYEPQQVTLTGTLESQTGAGLALISYQHGDYTAAANQFDQLHVTKTVPEMALLWGNSLLFAGQYDAAIDVYQDIILPLKPRWAAVHNNLGLARFDQSFLDLEGVPQAGIDHFEQAIKFAIAQDEIDLAIMAHSNSSLVLVQAASWNQAKIHCEVALRLNSQSATPYICRTINNFFVSSNNVEQMAMNQIKLDLDQAKLFGAPPYKLYYYHAAWYQRTGKNKEAVENYLGYLQEMKYRACLHIDRMANKDATDYLNQQNQ